MEINTDIPEDSAYLLIAEDSQTQAEQLKHILEHSGYRVKLADNGRHALDIARANKPTLLISDIIMPGMDGYQLCEQIKTDADLRKTPVILTTSLGDPEDVIRGLACGADNFIVKPYKEQYLLSRIKFAIDNHGRGTTTESHAPVDIYFNGKKHVVTADRVQILYLLLSTYEAAIQRSNELSRLKDDLRKTNDALNSTNVELAIANQRLQIEIAERELAEKQLNSLNNELIQAVKTTASGKKEIKAGIQ